MTTSECLYCGMTTSSENSICETCDFAVSASQNLDDAIESERDNPQNTYVNNFGVQQQTTPETSAASFHQSSTQSSENNYPPRDFRPPRQTTPRASCVICHRQIPAGQKVCFSCGNKKLPVKKFKMGFALFAILALSGIGFYAYKIYVQNSPTAVLKKYALATGSDKIDSIDTLISKGKVGITLTASPANKAQARTMNEAYSFELTLQKPNKSYMVFFKTDPAFPGKKEIVYKQAFDGLNGWKYGKMFNQPASLEDSNSGSSQGRPEMFLESFDSVEYLTDEMKEEYGEANLEPLMSISSYSVDGLTTTPKSKAVIQVVKNNQKTLFVFDKDTNLLLGIYRKEKIRDVFVAAIFYVDNYKTITIKGKNSEDVSFLTPTKWKFDINEEKPKDIIKGVPSIGIADPTKVSVSMSMSMDMQKTESGQPLEDKVFFKPLSITTAELQ